MADWSTMADVPNPIFDINGDPYSGAVLRAFLPGTTDATSIAIDKDGSSPQTSITANSEGKWEVSGAEIIPFIDREHKWGIFANATDATAKSPFYMGPFDNIEQSSTLSAATGASVANITALKAVTGQVDGEYTTLIAHTSNGIGGGLFTFDSSSTDTDNNGTIIQPDVGSGRWLRIDKGAKLESFGGLLNEITSDSTALQAVINYAKGIAVSKALQGEGTSVQCTPVVELGWGVSGVCYIDTQIDLSGVEALYLKGNGETVILGPTPNESLTMFSGTSLQFLRVEGVWFQNFDTCWSISNGNTDQSRWTFTECHATVGNKFIDGQTHSLSRSTLTTFTRCTFRSGLKDVGIIYSDVSQYNSCWFQTDNSSTFCLTTNSNATFQSCIFVAGGDNATGRAWVKFTNDDGDSGTTSEDTRNLNFKGCRFSNEGGNPAIVFADFPQITQFQMAPVIQFDGCYINAIKVDEYDATNGASVALGNGIVVINQYPAQIKFNSCSITNLGNANSKLIATTTSLPSTVPENFRIDLDEATYWAVKKNVGSVSNERVAHSLRGYINNPNPYMYRGNILENGYLDVIKTVDVGAYSAVSGEFQCNFTVTSNYNSPTGANQHPTIFLLTLMGFSDDSNPDIAHSGSSVYMVSINGGNFPSGNKARISSTKLHGDTWGFNDLSDADIVTLAFGVDEEAASTAGANITATAVTYNVFCIFGESMGSGKARITPLAGIEGRFTDDPT